MTRELHICYIRNMRHLYQQCSSQNTLHIILLLGKSDTLYYKVSTFAFCKCLAHVFWHEAQYIIIAISSSGTHGFRQNQLKKATDTVIIM